MRIVVGVLLVAYSIVSMAVMMLEVFTCRQSQGAKAFRVVTVPVTVILVVCASIGWFADDAMEWLMSTEARIARYESAQEGK